MQTFEVFCVGRDDEDRCAHSAVDVWQDLFRVDSSVERRVNEGLCGQLVMRKKEVSVRFFR